MEKRLTPLLERTIFEIVMKLFVTNGSHGKAHQTHMLNDKETNMLKSDIVESLGVYQSYMDIVLELLNEDLLRTIQNSLPRVLRKNIMNKEEMSSIKSPKQSIDPSGGDLCRILGCMWDSPSKYNMFTFQSLGIFLEYLYIML